MEHVYERLADWAAHAVVPGMIRFVVIVGGVALFGALAYRWGWVSRIQDARVPRAQYVRELIHAAAANIIFTGTVGVGLFAGVLHFDPSMGILAAAAICLLMIVLHDAWFYWTHRLLHTRHFVRFHKLHHLSRTPTAWTAYAFHPVEALIQALFIFAAGAVLPLSAGSVFGFMAFMVTRNAMGHSGYEMFPANAAGRPRWPWSTTVTHHDLHHSRGSGNYGLYFTFWDRLMGTENPRYLEAFAAAARRAPAAGLPRADAGETRSARP